MTIEEAIKHCHEKAEHLKNGIKTCQSMTATEQADCLECATEHEQLAEWLTELRDRREGKAACENCEYENRAEMQYPCVSCKHNHTDKYRPKKTTSAENDWYDIPAEEMTKEQAQKAVKELRKALLDARTEADNPTKGWVKITSPASNETLIKCPYCEDEFIGNDVEDYKFCPICGKKMREEAKHG